MFHKAKCFNHQIVQLKINRFLVNRDAKVLQKKKTKNSTTVFTKSLERSQTVL